MQVFKTNETRQMPDSLSYAGVRTSLYDFCRVQSKGICLQIQGCGWISTFTLKGKLQEEVKNRSDEMPPATKPDDQSSTPGICMAEGEI